MFAIKRLQEKLLRVKKIVISQLRCIGAQKCLFLFNFFLVECRMLDDLKQSFDTVLEIFREASQDVAKEVGLVLQFKSQAQVFKAGHNARTFQPSSPLEGSTKHQLSDSAVMPILEDSSTGKEYSKGNQWQRMTFFHQNVWATQDWILPQWINNRCAADF